MNYDSSSITENTPPVDFNYEQSSTMNSKKYSPSIFEDNKPKIQSNEERMKFFYDTLERYKQKEKEYKAFKYEDESSELTQNYFSFDQLKKDKDSLLRNNFEIDKEMERINKLFHENENNLTTNTTPSRRETKTNFNKTSNKNIKNKSSSINKTFKKSTTLKSKSPSIISNITRRKSKVTFDINKPSNVKPNSTYRIKEENAMLKKEITRLKRIRDDLLRNSYRSKINDSIDDEFEEYKRSRIDREAIRKEICLWRERAFKLQSNFINCLNEIRKQMDKDKVMFQEDLKKLHKNSENQINDIYKKYLFQIAKNEKEIEAQKKEYKNLMQQQIKVKEVFHCNFEI